MAMPSAVTFNVHPGAQAVSDAVVSPATGAEEEHKSSMSGREVQQATELAGKSLPDALQRTETATPEMLKQRQVVNSGEQCTEASLITQATAAAMDIEQAKNYVADLCHEIGLADLHKKKHFNALLESVTSMFQSACPPARENLIPPDRKNLIAFLQLPCLKNNFTDLPGKPKACQSGCTR